jgi:diaminopimelate decarboxylase
MLTDSSVMVQKTVPFDLAFIRELAETYPTPFYLYDEQRIRENARRLTAAFAWCDAFHEFFAVKATPNPYLLEILREEGFGADCSSLTELMLCDAVGIRGEDIMFSSNDTPAKDYAKARELGALINLDDITHIDYLRQTVGLPAVLSFRYNPGPVRKGNAIIGTPEEAKYGFTRDQLFEGYRRLKKLGIQRLGLHTMVVSNELNAEYFLETSRMLFELVVEIAEKLDVRLEFVNFGGGIGIPYRPTEEPVDLEYIGNGIQQLYQQMIEPAGLHPLKIFTENGRMVTGPFGYLVTKAIHKKDIYKQYIGVDACMANLMRPGMYGAYHHITVLGKEDAPHDHTYDIAGSLCENNDKFAIDRSLPEIENGDFLVIHDSGAHGHAMGFQYNGKLRSAELLIRSDGSIQQIRRAETASDYFATLDYAGLPRS